MIAPVRSRDYKNSMVGASLIKIKFGEQEKIISIARNYAAFLPCGLVEHFPVFRAGEAKFSDVDGIDTFGLENRCNFFT
ncbi:MAG: hypothetical protein P8Z71_10700 [Candidatus Sulfobium sp.]